MTTTGITAADIGAVVQAEITVIGGIILYIGCWEVFANAPVLCRCTNSLPNADVTAQLIQLLWVVGIMPDCTYCVIRPMSTC